MEYIARRRNTYPKIENVCGCIDDVCDLYTIVNKIEKDLQILLGRLNNIERKLKDMEESTKSLFDGQASLTPTEANTNPLNYLMVRQDPPKLDETAFIDSVL